jgi:hypothetical protein
MVLKEKLLHIQTELKAPKGQFNNFGKYKYVIKNLEQNTDKKTSEKNK